MLNTLTEREISRIFERRNFRTTEPRLKVIRELAFLPSSFSAEDLCDRLEQVGRATVFRTLSMLVEENILCRLLLPNNRVKYKLNSVFAHHHHVICVICEGVQSVTFDDLELVIEHISKGMKTPPISHEVNIFVECSECKAQAGGQYGK